MDNLPIFLIVIGVALFIALILRKDDAQEHLDKTVLVQGIRLKVTLSEVYSVLNVPGALGPLKAIIDGPTRKMIWDDTMKASEPNDKYYNVGDYILIIDRPFSMNLESIHKFETTVRKKLDALFKRDVFVGIIDGNGHIIDAPILIASRVGIILFIVFVLLISILLINRAFFGSLQKISR